MKSLIVVLAVAIWALTATAQPWSWEPLSGDYYNPTNFPQYHFDWFAMPVNHIGGDFDGDGRAEFLDAAGVIATLDNDNTRLHWSVQSNQPWPWLGLANVRGFSVRHMTGRDAVLVFTDSGIVGYAAIRNGDQWTWVVEDSVTAGLYAPTGTAKAVYGDFDGSGEMQAVFMFSGYDPTPHFEFWRLLTPGGWHYDSTYTDQDQLSQGAYGLFDGDFDEDGVIEVALVMSHVDSWFWITALDRVDGILQPRWLYEQLGGPMVGDFDGDGHLDALFLCDGCSGYRFGTIVPNTQHFASIESSADLTSLNGPIIGDYHVGGESLPFGAQNAKYSWVGFPRDFSESVYRTLHGWELVPGSWYRENECLAGSMGDLNGDGLKDLLIEGRDNLFSLTRHDWYLYKNIGSTGSDNFVHNAVLAEHFLANTDTLFSSPCLGDVDGDGRAELAMIAAPQHGGTSAVMFYDLSGAMEDTTFVGRPDLTFAISTGTNKIALGDVDNDGQTELFVRSDRWQSYFHRGGAWGEYDIHIPDPQAAWLGFADENGDGFEDLFTPTNVWLNLTPDAARPGPTLAPSSFSLSLSPNPFNPCTRFAFALPNAGRVSLRVFDVTGRVVETLLDGRFEAGEHAANFDGSRLASGIYFARLDASGLTTTRKMVLVK